LWDPDRISQVVSNLVSNAATYATEATPISVELVGSDQDASLRVRNEGPPIPEAQLSKLFEPFERASRKTRSPSEGLGLGLFIADQVVRAHGGRIEAKSDSTATVFEVHLPRAPAH
jgi:signal transduction histidine kinase